MYGNLSTYIYLVLIVAEVMNTFSGILYICVYKRMYLHLYIYGYMCRHIYIYIYIYI
jgi:hypothetical protein